MGDYARQLTQIASNIDRVLVGKHRSVRLALCCLLCRGHALIEDVPGVGKTSLASALARSFDCSYRRIQGTPDVLPSDITGFTAPNRQTGEFEFRPGAIQAQIILVDEINRMSPKTQSSLLECMEERQVTVDGTTHALPEPFIVLATQNPVEYQGTWPLPEAQLDRFFMRIALGYPTPDEEARMLELHSREYALPEVKPVSDAAALIAMQQALREIRVGEPVRRYIVSLIQATRAWPGVRLGASPRATLSLQRAAQAAAMLDGRDYCLPDDVQEMTEPVLLHRMVFRHAGAGDARVLLGELLASVEVPQ